MATLLTKFRALRSTFSPFYPTEHDLQVYKRLTEELGAPPNAHICRFLGAEGQHLVFLGDSGTREWARVQRLAAQRWPGLPHPGLVARDGKTMDSLPERIVYDMLRGLLRRHMKLDVHQPILQQAGDYRADMTLRKGQASLFIEVVGCCGSDRITRNQKEQEWLQRFDKRMAFYRAHAIAPVCIWLDQFAQPGTLRKLCINLVDAIALEGARS